MSSGYCATRRRINVLISAIFAELYIRQLRQSRVGIEISPSRSHRYSVAFEISKK
jgi:hypothetical protein